MKLSHLFSSAFTVGLALSVPAVLAQGPAGPPAAAGGSHLSRRFDGKGAGMPFGIWWKDDAIVKAIGLTPDQQKKIDDIFLKTRVQLIHMHASLEEEETLLGPIMDANPIDQGKASAQIDKIADTRADLEKTNAKMLLSIRSVLSADQWTKLRELHHSRRGPDGPWGQKGRPGGPDGPAGPHGRRSPDGPPPAAPAGAPNGDM